MQAIAEEEAAAKATKEEEEEEEEEEAEEAEAEAIADATGLPICAASSASWASPRAGSSGTNPT